MSCFFPSLNFPFFSSPSTTHFSSMWNWESWYFSLLILNAFSPFQLLSQHKRRGEARNAFPESVKSLKEEIKSDGEKWCLWTSSRWWLFYFAASFYVKNDDASNLNAFYNKKLFTTCSEDFVRVMEILIYVLNSDVQLVRLTVSLKLAGKIKCLNLVAKV